MEDAEEQTSIVSATTVATPGGDTDYDVGRMDTTNIAKGKRTKRQRPQSPIRLITFSSSNNDLTSSSSSFAITTEDEDTAESLILLSKGLPRKNKDDGIFKFNSKKFIQSPINGAAGMFVYECKTCSRTFPSFQALGGHRASHRKPRNNEPLPYTAVIANNDPPEYERNDHYYSSLSFQLNNHASFIGNTIKPSSKLHECGICGTEFNSGQALGGHMRRHRVAGGRNKGNATLLSLIPYNPETTVEVYDHKSNNDNALYLGLDLNLPAPQTTMTTTTNHNQRQKPSFEFSPTVEKENHQQPPVDHLSPAPTLVDCHY